MKTADVRNTENFWIEVVKGSLNVDNEVTYVPLDGLSRGTAARLATSLNVMVFIKGNHYLFTTSLQAVLEDDHNVH